MNAAQGLLLLFYTPLPTVLLCTVASRDEISWCALCCNETFIVALPLSLSRLPLMTQVAVWERFHSSAAPFRSDLVWLDLHAQQTHFSYLNRALHTGKASVKAPPSKLWTPATRKMFMKLFMWVRENYFYFYYVVLSEVVDQEWCSGPVWS